MTRLILLIICTILYDPPRPSVRPSSIPSRIVRNSKYTGDDLTLAMYTVYRLPLLCTTKTHHTSFFFPSSSFPSFARDRAYAHARSVAFWCITLSSPRYCSGPSGVEEEEKERNLVNTKHKRLRSSVLGAPKASPQSV
jgi:hypothetical protein